MKRTTLLIYSSVASLSLLAAGTFVGGCKSDDDNSRRLSQKQEACQTSNDCADGLSCIPIGSTGNGECLPAAFNIAQTAKDCVLTECSQKSECCYGPNDFVPHTTSTCSALAISCAQDSGFPSTDCDNYNLYCKCDLTRVDCIQDRCQWAACRSDTECFPGISHCSVGQCVQCVTDAHCSDGNVCVNGACQAPCTVDSQCPAFNRCQSGKCVQAGCKTDRECVAYTKHSDATCGTDGSCITPCQTDHECGQYNNYLFYSCISNKCTYTGCNDDKECEYAPLPDGGSKSTGSPKAKLVCRDRKTQ